MLFTDLDIQDKGRPGTAVVDGGPQDHAAPHLLLLDDIARQLDLDFLDDDDDPAPESPGESTEEPDAPRPDAPLPVDDETGDDLLSMDDAPPAGAWSPPTTDRPAAPQAAEVPTWESFINAFRHGGLDIGPPPPQSAPSGLPAEAERFFAVRPPEPKSLDNLLDGDDIDILSILASEPESEPGPAPEPEVQFIDDAAPDTPPRSRRSHTVTVPPPPAVPYGGIERVEDWYVPPEDDRVFTMPTDWYEVPEEIGGPSGSTPQSTDPASAGAPPRAKKDTEKNRRNRQSTRQRRKENSTGAVDMFSDFNLDEIWDERVREVDKQKYSTRSLDLFDGLDLDELWEQRSPTPDIGVFDQGGGVNPEALRAQMDDIAAGDTIILSTTSKDADSTVIIPSEELQQAGITKTDTVRLSRPISEDEAADLLAELDNFSEQDLPIEDDQAKSGDPERAAKRETRRATREETSSGTKRRSRRSTTTIRDEPLVDSSLLDGDGPELDMSGGIVVDDSLVDDDDAFSPESVSHTRRLTTDDLLNEGFDDLPGINADLSAPVIDDSAITRTSGPRPGTEEMEAIMERHETGEFDDPAPSGGAKAPVSDPEDAVAAQDGDDQEEEEEEDVAVNPMDVFANMDDMDFSDDMDDEMRAMMDEEEEANAEGEESAGAEGAPAEVAAMVEPTGFVAKLVWRAGRVARRVLPGGFIDRVQQMVAWRENWWFYCDLVAAIIASASLAVIISYYIWYRN